MELLSRSKVIITIILGALLGAGLVAAQSGDDPLVDFSAIVANLQTNYLAEHDQYAQVIAGYPMDEDAQMMAPPPTEMWDQLQYWANPTPGPVIICPADQASCPEILAPPGMTVTIDVYESVSGTGYTISYRWIDDDGFRWLMRENVGPETWRALDWTPLSPLQTPEAP